MVRMLSLCALLAAWPAFGLAQEKAGAKDTAVSLTVQPMSAPVPALKYQLLPELKEMNPGNPIQGFMKCFMGEQNFFFKKESSANMYKWHDMPLHELRSLKLKQYGGPALLQADYAARLDTVDWQVLLQVRSGGYRLALPEVQQFRMLAVSLSVRFRSEIADGRFDDAVRTCKTMLALARTLEDHPGIISTLVGDAVAVMSLKGLEEMIQQPGCPNLYWALTNLPSPLIDTRKGLQGEEIFAATEFSGINQVVPMSSESLAQVKDHLIHLMAGVNAEREQQKLKTWLERRATDEVYVREARSRLEGSGVGSGRVKDFPPLQVVLLDEKREYQVRMDEGRKWAALPYWQAEAGSRSVSKQGQGDHQLANLFLPYFVKFRVAQSKVDRTIALLRQAEAFRLYAADHDGKLPPKLEDLPVPVPIDPIHGKPFDYTIEGESAVLRATSPVGYDGNPSLQYIVTIKK